jgi:predicted ATPase
MKIGLQNFQGVGAYTEIPIAPITLFYGPNSAGKSTVTDAFNFLSNALSGQDEGWREDLVRHARKNRDVKPLKGVHLGDPDDIAFLVSCMESRLGWGGWLETHKLDFIDFIENHPGIKEAFYEKHLDEDNETYWQIKSEFQFQLLFSCDESGGCYTPRDGSVAYLRESQMIINELPLFRFRSNGMNQVELSFNQLHPIYPALDKQWTLGLQAEITHWFTEQVSEESIEGERWLTISGAGKSKEFTNHPIHWPTFFKGGDVNQHIHEANPNLSLSPFSLHQFLEWFMVMPARSAASATSIHTITPIRPIPVRSEEIVFDGYGESHLKTNKNELDAWGILSGYIRDCELGDDPEGGESVPHERDLLPCNPLAFVNHILSSPDYLDTGYVVKGDVKLSFDMDLEGFNNLIGLKKDKRRERLFELKTKVHPYLEYKPELPEGFKVEIEDVGVGISQVIPVLVACWQIAHGSGGEMADDWCQTVHIQQPELHLHPKLQAQLGDVFLKSIRESGGIDRGFFLLESHSEHLLLRILRRIREHYPAMKYVHATTGSTDKFKFEGRLKYAIGLLEDESFMKTLSKNQMSEIVKLYEEGQKTGKFSIPEYLVRPEDKALLKSIDAINMFGTIVNADLVSVVYVKKDEDGLTKMSHLRIAEDGEFIDRWPDGFFTDRDIELFGDEGPFA